MRAFSPQPISLPSCIHTGASASAGGAVAFPCGGASFHVSSVFCGAGSLDACTMPLCAGAAAGAAAEAAGVGTGGGDADAGAFLLGGGDADAGADARMAESTCGSSWCLFTWMPTLCLSNIDRMRHICLSTNVTGKAKAPKVANLQSNSNSKVPNFSEFLNSQSCNLHIIHKVLKTVRIS